MADSLILPGYAGPLSELDSGSASTAASGTMTRLEYPQNHSAQGGPVIMFNRYKYKKANMEASGVAQPAEGSSTVALPLPPSLNASYETQWDNQSLGIAGNQLANAGGEGLTSAIKLLGEGRNLIDAFQAVKGAVPGLGKYIENNILDAATDNAIADKLGLAIGVARNPYQAIIFNSPRFRNFAFNWKFFARNQQESEQIHKIYQEFKIGMSPDFSGIAGEDMRNNLFEYPDMWQISFDESVADHLFKIHFCVLSRIDIEYHAENSPLYFNVGGKKIPASMTLAAQFQEMKILTREDLRAGY